MWVGIDDTDGPDGGCTTYVLTSIIEAANRRGFDLLGFPQLVRLDPNVPWKTRGNGALSARFGHGLGPPEAVGRIGRRVVTMYRRGRPLSPSEQAELFAAAQSAVLAGSSHAPRTDPALVVAPRRPDPHLYRAAVAEVVPRGTARAALRSAGGRAWFRDGTRGLVGATAAIAWPGRRRTFEALAYRAPGRIGTRRLVDAASVRATASRHPELFLCDDPETRRLLVAPHTACPILFGVRSTEASVLPAAMQEIRSEPIERWMIFASNQGTGDHLVPRTLESWPTFSAGTLIATVMHAPETIRGGHVRLRLRSDSGASVEAWAFEPTKTLTRVARSLLPGDRVRVAAGRGRSRSLGIERLTLLRLVPRWGPARPPRCRACRRTADSRGAGRGYRCGVCRARFPPESAVRIRGVPEFLPGQYDPTPSARRHLHPRVPPAR